MSSLAPLALILALTGCRVRRADVSTSTTRTSATISPPPAASAPQAPSDKPSPRPHLDGRDFPEGVLALTWDDGPDTGTLALAQYLHDQHVNGTFFVVAEWKEGVSSDPGEGKGVFQTGYAHLPVLGDLQRLGHRIANHTSNHVLLTRVDEKAVVAQLAENQARIDPFVTGGLRFFRAPGGAFGDAASAAVDGDPRTRVLVGPIRWDIDGKDWEKSLYCRSDKPSTECEPKAPGGASRVKPAVIANRYLAAVDEARHGVVLFHDRVGHVGGSMALDIARRVIPALRQKGYVFAAPVLRFGPFSPRDSVEQGPSLRGDLNGDGREDTCARTSKGLECAFGALRGTLKATTWAHAKDLTSAGLDATASLWLTDVNGDGRADVCGRGARGTVCALAP